MKATHTRAFVIRLSVIVAAILIIIISSVVLSNNILRLQEATCNQTLTDTLSTLTDDLHHNLYGHRVYLQSIAAILSDYDNLNDPDILGILQNYKSDAIVNRLDILLPNGEILTPDDTRYQADPSLSFKQLSTEASDNPDKAYGVTGKLSCHMKDIEGHDHMIACIHTPIYQNGKIAGILLGVIELEKLTNLVDTDIFGGNANIYIIDGLTGDILVDTGESGVDNIWNWGSNPLADGYSKDQLSNDLIQGNSGQVKFSAQDTGVDFYFCYDQIENTNWRVGIAVKEDAAFASVSQMRETVIIFFIVVIACMSVIMWMILLHANTMHQRTKLLSETDLLTECRNRNKYELDMAELVSIQGNYLGCVYIDVNGLREHNNQSGHDQGDLMLRIIAEHIRKHFGNRHTYRIGGDEFVVILRQKKADTEQKLEELSREIEHIGYSVSIGFAEQNSTRDASALTRLAEQIMYKKKAEYYKNLNSPKS